MTEQAKVDFEALGDLCTPWCLRVAVTLRIAETISDGVHEIGELAAATGCAIVPLHFVLRHLAGKGVFVETSPGTFVLNEAAQALCDPGMHIGFDLTGIGGRMAGAWATLPGYVKTGAPAYHEQFGLPFWEDLDAHPEVSASFDALIGPAGHGTPNAKFDLADGWDGVKTVVDVGGGTGAMLAELLRQRQALSGILVDLPRTVARSTAIFEVAGVIDRVTAVGQSFFDPLPRGADLYLLKGILNDWPADGAVAILERCAEAAHPAGRVIVLGGVTDNDLPSYFPIESLLLGGEHRTLAQLSELATAAGLDTVASGQQSHGHFVVELRPR